tara:strand:- start:1570 stop:1704 length:135 start_codon:yes stop_codon:yes gene_type:complete
MKAWVERNNFVPEFIEAGGMDGEYFYLIPLLVTQSPNLLISQYG